MRLRWILGLTILIALAMTGLSTRLAHADKPIITTPTPALPLRPRLPENASLAPSRGLTLTWPLDEDLPTEVSAEAFTYTVGISDTVWTLALNFGRDLDTMACTTRPRGDDAATLIPGTVITVPALRDVCYTVTPFDTLSGIAARHGLTVQQVAAVPWNDLQPPYAVQPRQRILLPGARPWAPVRPSRDTIRNVISVPGDAWAGSPWPQWPYGDGQFTWPVVGAISQGFHASHRAVDIAVPAGTPVLAADRGTVLMAGWSPTGYGFRVVIDHHIDYVTLYAHLSDIYVQEGQIVGKGQVIGLAGANGNVTGPHLHFEIRDFGILTDPIPLLAGHAAAAAAGQTGGPATGPAPSALPAAPTFAPVPGLKGGQITTPTPGAAAPTPSATASPTATASPSPTPSAVRTRRPTTPRPIP